MTDQVFRCVALRYDPYSCPPRTRIVAVLYKTRIRMKDGEIVWCKESEALDRYFPGDYRGDRVKNDSAPFLEEIKAYAKQNEYFYLPDVRHNMPFTKTLKQLLGI